MVGKNYDRFGSLALLSFELESHELEIYKGYDTIDKF